MSRPKRNVIKPTRFGNTLDYDELQNLIALPDEIDPAPAAAPAEDAGAAQPVAEVAAAVPAPAPVELAREGGNAAQGEIGAQASAGKQTKRARAISDDERDDAGSSQEKGGVYDPVTDVWKRKSRAAKKTKGQTKPPRKNTAAKLARAVDRLDLDTWSEIASHLDLKTLLALARACKHFRYGFLLSRHYRSVWLHAWNVHVGPLTASDELGNIVELARLVFDYHCIICGKPGAKLFVSLRARFCHDCTRAEFIELTPEMLASIHYDDTHRTLLTSIGHPVAMYSYQRNAPIVTPHAWKRAFLAAQAKVVELTAQDEEDGGESLQEWIDEREVQVGKSAQDLAVTQQFVDEREVDKSHANHIARAERYATIIEYCEDELGIPWTASRDYIHDTRTPVGKLLRTSAKLTEKKWAVVGPQIVQYHAEEQARTAERQRVHAEHLEFMVQRQAAAALLAQQADAGIVIPANAGIINPFGGAPIPPVNNVGGAFIPSVNNVEDSDEGESEKEFVQGSSRDHDAPMTFDEGYGSDGGPMDEEEEEEEEDSEEE